MSTTATILADGIYRTVVDRIGRIDERSQRVWGRMSADQMLCHCTDQIRLALAQKPATETASWFNRNIAIHIALALPRIPLRNLATPTDMRQGNRGLGTKPVNLAHDKRLLLAALADFRQHPADQPLSPHPGYGPLNRTQYGRFIYLHLDHHLRQFGA
ncbi:DUF1569 domain-containing protein [Hymenobacter terrenus]|uniref:DUF1569 domain-containing protein n=1 Tax=Hymenobacter terrenus TaxID=1629124 RepID=UPI000619F925|nr:DUF1569 domain-containing protein [Hymenobacter terrenus]